MIWGGIGVKRASMITISVAGMLCAVGTGSLFSDAAAFVAEKTTDSKHEAYMSGTGTGFFMPDAALTRAEAAQLLSSLLGPDQSGGGRGTFYPDVPDTAWYYQAVSRLADEGVLEGAGGLFDPALPITRATFILWLTRINELTDRTGVAVEAASGFSDVPEEAWYHNAVTRAAAQGWVNGFKDGTFRPDSALSRAEAAVIVNRALNRAPDYETIHSSENMRFFPDLSVNHWAYNDIMEATVSHDFTTGDGGERWSSVIAEATSLTAGLHTAGGELYYVLDNGMFARNITVGNLPFGSDGRYTSGSEDLDKRVKEALATVIKDGMTREEQLEAAFNFIVDGSFSYIPRDHIAFRAKDWEVPLALQMLQQHKGNCYYFASAFCALARQLGYDADVVSGYVTRTGDDHGWVEITAEDGSVTCYDPTFETTYRSRGQSYNLFGFTYENASFTYIK